MLRAAFRSPGSLSLVLVSSALGCHAVSGVDELQVSMSSASVSASTSATGSSASSGQGGTGGASTASSGAGGTAASGGGSAVTTTTSASISTTSGTGGGGGAGGGAALPQPSCDGLASTCGSANVDCCTSDLVVGGSFVRDNDPKLPATVSSFRLDRFEVTVGRYRKFVDAVVNGGWKPQVGAGKHLHVGNGKGLDGELGWVDAWSAMLPSTSADWNSTLACPTESASDYQTWTSNVGGNENKPINCVSWFQAYAFCIWDGGFLPTENELNFASASTANNLYPWGAAAPTQAYATYLCGGDACSKTSSEIFEVGKKPMGDGFFKTTDLAGNVAEWALDVWQLKSSLPFSCKDCVNVPTGNTGESGVQRGGSFGSSAAAQLGNASNRYDYTQKNPASAIGVRCAYTP